MSTDDGGLLILARDGDRQCTRCDAGKPANEFRRRNDCPDGCGRVCKACEAGDKRRRDEVVRAAVFAWYGETCSCCGTAEALTIDHVAGAGTEQRRQATGGNHGGNVFYRWLIANGFPAGFQSMCSTCNKSKGNRAACMRAHECPTRRCSRCGVPKLLSYFMFGLKRCDPCVLADRARARS